MATSEQRLPSTSVKADLPVLLLVVALLAAACGTSGESGIEPSGGDDAGVQPEQDGEDAQPEGDDGADDGSNSSDGPAAGGTTASVVLGGVTHEFSPGAFGFCQIDENGLFKASIVNDDMRSIEVSLPPDGFVADDIFFASDEYPSVVVLLSDSERWSANAYESDPQNTNNRNIPEGQTQVDSYRFDALGASGEATFVDLEALTHNADDGSFFGEPVTGSFQISCS